MEKRKKTRRHGKEIIFYTWCTFSVFIGVLLPSNCQMVAIHVCNGKIPLTKQLREGAKDTARRLLTNEKCLDD